MSLPRERSPVRDSLDHRLVTWEAALDMVLTTDVTFLRGTALLLLVCPWIHDRNGK